MQTLRIFISSPSDVTNERQIAGKVIARLQGKYWSFVRLEDVFWERSVTRATAHFQDDLHNPGDCDIVIGILWSRLGSPLPKRFQNQLGNPEVTGTEWELNQAFAAYEKNLAVGGDPVLAKPDVVIYRRRSEPEDYSELGVKQLEALENYLSREFHYDDEHHTIKRALNHYLELEEFERKLYGDLEQLILKRLPTLKPGFDPPPISGSPFKGLAIFDYDDCDRFFGRTQAIREVQRHLSERAESGNAFVLIYGASGHGKSSLMRAGVAPVITRPGGALPDMDRWRRVLLVPGIGTGPLHERLAREILAPTPERETERAKLQESYAPSGFSELAHDPIPKDTADSMASTWTWDVASLARYLGDVEDQVVAITALREALERENLYLLLQIDQLEEVFTEFDAEEREAFFLVLAHL